MEQDIKQKQQEADAIVLEETASERYDASLLVGPDSVITPDTWIHVWRSISNPECYSVNIEVGQGRRALYCAYDVGPDVLEIITNHIEDTIKEREQHGR